MKLIKTIRLKIYPTNLTHKEIKRSRITEEKSYFLDMNKLIEENFKTTSELSNTQYWILNQIMIKKIEAFLSSKYEVIYIYFQNPTKDKIKALKELITDNKIKNVIVEPLKA